MSCTTIVSENALVTVLETTCTTVTLATCIGARGPVGLQGPSGPLSFVRLSASAISALRVVRTVSATHVAYADSDTLAHAETVLGISLTSTSAAEEELTIIASGAMTDGSWTWTPNQAIYAGPNGVLTQTFSSLWAWSRAVAWAQSATSIVVQIREPIALV